MITIFIDLNRNFIIIIISIIYINVMVTYIF